MVVMGWRKRCAWEAPVFELCGAILIYQRRELGRQLGRIGIWAQPDKGGDIAVAGPGVGSRA